MLSSNQMVLPLNSRSRQNGQVIIEYILLLVVVLSLSAIIMKSIVSRGDQPGFLMKKWQDLVTQVGSDDPGNRSAVQK